MSLNSIIKGLLKESALNDLVKDSIKKRYEVRIKYNAPDENPETVNRGTNTRLIQPVALGLTKSGNPVVRAFQPYGDTKSKIPSWKFFRLDRIEDWKPNKRTHFKEPPGMYSAEGVFNKTGDNSMSRVDIVADFEGASRRYEKGGLKAYNQQRQDRAREKNPYYDLLKNINRSKNIENPVVTRNLQHQEPKKPNYWADYDKAREEALDNEVKALQQNATTRDAVNNSELEYASRSLNNITDTETTGVQQKGNYETATITNGKTDYSDKKTGVIAKNNNGLPLNNVDNDKEEEN